MAGVGFADKDRAMELGESGANVPAMLDYLLRRDRKRLGAICESMRHLVPGFEDINITTPDPAQRQVEFVSERGLTIPGSLASVGVRLLLFIVTLVRHPSPPRIILLEEPENGVHPRRLGDIMRLLRDVTEGGATCSEVFWCGCGWGLTMLAVGPAARRCAASAAVPVLIAFLLGETDGAIEPIPPRDATVSQATGKIAMRIPTVTRNFGWMAFVQKRRGPPRGIAQPRRRSRNAFKKPSMRHLDADTSRLQREIA